jgi:hypothetical protein
MIEVVVEEDDLVEVLVSLGRELMLLAYMVICNQILESRMSYSILQTAKQQE